MNVDRTSGNGDLAAIAESERDAADAKSLAGRLNSIVVKLTSSSEDDLPKYGLEFEKDWLHFGASGTLHGFPEVVVLIEHNLVNDKFYEGKVGVKTDKMVVFSLCTDQEIWELVREDEAWKPAGFTLEQATDQLQDMFSPEELDEMIYPDIHSDEYATYCFVDEDGNFAKAVGIPEKFASGREDLQIAGNPIGEAPNRVFTVLSKMTPRDFVILKSAVGVIERKLGISDSAEWPQG